MRHWLIMCWIVGGIFWAPRSVRPDDVGFTPERTLTLTVKPDANELCFGDNFELIAEVSEKTQEGVVVRPSKVLVKFYTRVSAGDHVVEKEIGYGRTESGIFIFKVDSADVQSAVHKMGPTRHSFFVRSEGYPDSNRHDMALFKIVDIKLAQGPEYTPTGKNVGGAPFETEVDDSLRFEAVTQPDDITGTKIIWNGDTIAGFKGQSVQVSYRTTGTKTLTAFCGHEGHGKTTATIYVNDNKNAPITNQAINLTTGMWAHVSDSAERVALTAHAIDQDWKYGTKSGDNRINLALTQWHTSSGKLNSTMGVNVEWSPLEAGTAEVSVTFYDLADPLYSPRTDYATQDPVTVATQVGGFTVKVDVIVGGSRIGQPRSAWMDENDGQGGDSLPIMLKGPLHVRGLLEEPGKPLSGRKEMHDSGESDITITWTYTTNPKEAVPRGNISAALSASVTGRMWSHCFDNEWGWFDRVKISWNISPKVGILGFSIGSDIKLGGNASGGVAMAYAFDSDDLGQKNPNATRHEHETSTGGNKSTPITYSDWRIVKKTRNGAESRARIQAFLKVQGLSINDGAYHVEAEILDSAVLINCTNVLYEP